MVSEFDGDDKVASVSVIPAESDEEIEEAEPAEE